MLFPKTSATMTDVWQVMGLKGTGSDNYSVHDLFVPEDYTFTRELAADRRETGPLYRFSIFNMFGVAFSRGRARHRAQGARRLHQARQGKGSVQRRPRCCATTA